MAEGSDAVVIDAETEVNSLGVQIGSLEGDSDDFVVTELESTSTSLGVHVGSIEGVVMTLSLCRSKVRRMMRLRFQLTFGCDG